jgi:ZIP family zinc transporter
VITGLLYGLATAVPIVAGAWVGLRFHVPVKVLGAIMSLGAGSMIAAVSQELFVPAFEADGALIAGSGLLAGAVVYVLASRLLGQRLGSAAIGWSLLLGILLDGIPENTALGVSIMDGGGAALLLAVAVGNVPEAVSGAAQMRGKVAAGRAMFIWCISGVLLVAVTVGGQWAADAISGTAISVVRAVAGGATIAVLADTLIPVAYKDSGWWTGIATAIGFLAAFVIG